MKDFTIKDIEMIKGIEDSEINTEEGSLPKWYDSIRNIPLSKLDDKDISILVRQNIYLEFIMNEVIKRLYANPFLGKKYDGELVAALAKRVDNQFWRDHEKFQLMMLELVEFVKINHLIDTYDWIEEEEKEDFITIFNNLYTNLVNARS